MALVNRHAYNQLPKTIAYLTNDTFAVPSGSFNYIQLFTTGTTTATGGADANYGSMGMIAQATFRSQKQGIIAQLTGVELYHMQYMFGSVPPITNCGADGGASMCVWGLPVCVDRHDTLYIDIEWNALAYWHSSATAYDGVLTCLPDFIPDFPTCALKYRHKQLGTAGVVGANAADVQIPQVIKNFQLFGFMCLQNDTAKGTFADDFLDYQLEHNHGFPLGAPVLACQMRMVQAREDTIAHPAGVDIIRFAPIVNDEGTQLTITNGATATVAETTITYFYISGNVAGHVYAKSADGFTKQWGIAPDLIPQKIGEDGKVVTGARSHSYPFGPGENYDPERFSVDWTLVPRSHSVGMADTRPGDAYGNHFRAFAEH